MRNFKVFVDSHCDYTKEEIEKMGFEYISMPYSINGKLIYPYEENYSAHEFYQSLRDGAKAKTHALSPDEYINIFEQTLKDGYDIVYISISDKMTSTHQNAEKAWNKRVCDKKLITVDIPIKLLEDNNDE
jgi:fatty acid-binding protein DegV